jgi:hypothetical protein
MSHPVNTQLKWYSTSILCINVLTQAHNQLFTLDIMDCFHAQYYYLRGRQNMYEQLV